MMERIELTGIVWKHEADLIEVTTWADKQPRWACAHVTAFVRTGQGDVSVRYGDISRCPALGSVVPVTLEVPAEAGE